MRTHHKSHNVRLTWDENHKQYEICTQCHLCPCHDPENKFAEPCPNDMRMHYGTIVPDTFQSSNEGNSA